MRKIKYISIICLWFILSSAAYTTVAAAEPEQSDKSTSSELTWQFAYDDAGRITELINPAGKRTKVHYELDNNKQIRIVEKEFPDASKVTYNFDHFGRRVGMADPEGTVRYKYDGFGCLTEVRRDGQAAISYTYDTMDRLSSMSLGDGLSIQYSYDFLGRLAKINTLAGDISYEYQTGQGMVIRTLPNGIRTIWEYGPDGSLQSISHAAKDNKVIAQFAYAYRPDGLINTCREWDPQGGRILAYEYDTVQRLISVEDSRFGKIRYGYDQFGNRIELDINGQSVTNEYDWAGRMLQHNGQASIHDAAGNLSTYISGDVKRTYEYNSVNLLRSASTSNSKVEYTYNGDGYLIARTVGVSKTTFVPDPLSDVWQPLVAINDKGEQTLYIWEGGVPLAALASDSTEFFLHDHLGSVRCIADDKGKIISRYEYSPFGMPRQKFPDNELHPGFAGLFFDLEASLYLTRARGYDPSLGRFLQQDPQHRIPFGSQKNLSAYAYCGGDPLNFMDLTGIAPQWFNTAWLHTQAFFTNLPRTTWEGIKGVFDFYRPSNITAGFRGGWEFGSPHPGTWAAQAEVYGGQFAKGAVQFILAQTVLFEIDIALGGLLPKTRLPLGKIGHLGVGEKAYFGAPHLGLFQRTIPGIKGTRAIFHLYGAKAFVHLGRLKFSIPYAWPLLFQPEEADAETISEAEREREKIIAALDDQERRYVGGPPPPPPPPPAVSVLEPSSVGGIYLRGAGKALEQLGPLKGIARDEKNGGLILISETDSQIDLPPLRMDDVVTIFRCVYEHGDAPYVSIDPNPEDPEGPIMLVRHDKGTTNTYIGWILFEADRIMKAYSLGCDNITQEPVKSKIENYQNLFDMGFTNFSGKQTEPIWERFWIVPATSNRYQTVSKQLTLFDVSLMVKTQRMEMRDGKLIPAEDDTPSEQARKFAEWFTQYYDQISSEVLSRSPVESDKDSPVAVYRELRRIALVTAIAETLRDQGVPLPTWMRNYPAKPCVVPKTTPAIVVEATKTKKSHIVEGDAIRTLESTQIQRIYGGVNLAVADEDIRVITAPEAESLAPIVTKRTTDVPMLTSVNFEQEGKGYRAVILPGDTTRDVGACRLIESDLVVPVGSQIALVRSFNSFFKPKDVLGNVAWTLDLQRLVEQRQPVRRSGDLTEYKMTYQLTSPLGTHLGTFRDEKHVPQIDGELLVPSSPSKILGMGNMQNDKIGYPTKVLFFHDGRRWHFDDAGNFVAQIEGALTVVYRRDNAHRVRRIEDWYGKNLRADIQLDYDKQGRLISARASNGDTVKYTYNEAGKLIHVESPKRVVDYQYKDELVAVVKQNGQTIREFEYNQNGQLIREKQEDGSETVYQLSSGPEGVKISAVRAENSDSAETAYYDASFRPVRRVFEDGTKIEWEYFDNGITESIITLPQGEQYITNQSAHSRKTTWQFPEGGTYTAEYDEGGRLVTLHQDNHMILHQEWHNMGQLSKVSYETVAIHPEYRKDGVQTAVFVTAIEKGPQFNRWLRIQYNELGRPEKVTDYSGSDITIGYDQTGQVGAIISKRGGVKIAHDQEGRVERAETSWGHNQYNTYDSKTNVLKKVEFTKGNNKAVVELDQGRLARLQQYDSGEFNISYNDQEASRGQLKQIQTPINLKLAYEYGSNNQLAAINCGSAYRFEYTYDAQDRLTKLDQVPIR